MRFSNTSRLIFPAIALLSMMLSGCILVGDFDDVYVPAGPTSITYEVCYSNIDCFAGDSCEELAVPADRYTDFVNAICTVGCFDDLECPISEFNGLPGACVDHVIFGGPFTSRICMERCEFDADCDVAAGFGCGFVDGDRLCIPVR